MLRVTLFLLIMSISLIDVSGGVITKIEINHGYGTTTPVPGIDFDLTIRHSAFGIATMFNDLIVDSSTVGKTFTAAPGDPGFITFADFLTNNRIDRVVQRARILNSGLGFASIYSDRGFLFGGIVRGGPFDLHGSTIGSFDLTVNSYSHESPGTDPNGDGQWSEISFALTLQINDNSLAIATPEPSTYALFGLGIGAVLLGHRRKSRVVEE